MELIDKAAVVAEIRNRVDSYKGDGIISIGVLKQHCEDFIYYLDTLEVKEVNFKKELSEWMRYGPHTNYPWCTIPDAIKITAEHFFELGLKAKKGE